ncbi:LysR substrate-binding domain-containing protein [Marinimicrobium alkaliphilum]|uniref:LysR substrate-binding domain-containing protein n=1 Tax=Marinimicrobium alkaliphilum TaxID=2202654 RepID=UPI000DB9428F|nr:LysR substrate-binding domain-containing protein [Marinimicrobium alkaliphilum]
MALKHLTLRQLEVFQEVVRQGSVSAAARHLHLTQPTVSIQLRKLAESAGAPLLESRDGRFQATEAGQALYLAAGDMLGRLQALGDELQHLQAGTRGQLSLGLVTTANYVLPKILGAFARAYPDVELSLTAGNRGQILERFRRQADDLYIFSHPPEVAEVVATPFLRNPLVMIAPPDHPLAGQSVLEPAALTGQRLLVREPGSGTGMALRAWLEQQPVGLTQTLQVASNEGIYSSVAGGLGLAVVSEHILRSRKEPVAVLPVRGFPLAGSWYLVHHKRRPLSPVGQVFYRYLREQLPVLEPDYALSPQEG